MKCIIGETVTAFDKEYIDFTGHEYTKSRYPMYHDFYDSAEAWKLKRIEFNGASFTSGTLDAVRKVGDVYTLEKVLLTHVSSKK